MSARSEERQRRAEERITAETARSIQRELVRHFRREGTFAGFPRRAPTLFPETAPEGGGMRATYDIVASPNAAPNAHPTSFVLRSRRGYTCVADVGVTPGALAAPSPPACGWGASAP